VTILAPCGHVFANSAHILRSLARIAKKQSACIAMLHPQATIIVAPLCIPQAGESNESSCEVRIEDRFDNGAVWAVCRVRTG
jgi:hypothetical protein